MAARRHQMPEPIGATLRSELDRLGVEDAALAVTRAWEAAVGPEVARNAWPARMRRDGTLVVHARTSVWAFELNQLAEEIRPRLTPTPEGLRFVVGNVPEPTGKRPAERSPKPLPDPDPASVQVAASLAASMSSRDVREALQKAASLGLSRPRDDRQL